MGFAKYEAPGADQIRYLVVTNLQDLLVNHHTMIALLVVFRIH